MKTNYVLFYLTIVFLLTAQTSFSANRYWVGSGSWNNTANWSGSSGGTPGSSVPGVFDIAIFDGANLSNCTINANVNIDGFSITSLYSGNIITNTGITLTVSASGFSQAAGTFAGNNGNITINGVFNLTGGIFTSTSATITTTGGFTYTAGIFNHNNGTISFSGTQNITGNVTFYNILFVANGGVYTITSGTTISSINNVTISGGFAFTINTGTLSIKGDLTLTSSSNNSLNGGTATFLFNGTGSQIINSATSSIILGTNERICNLPNVEINKLSGSLNLIGLINLNGTSWITSAGNMLINPGTSTVNINSSVTFSGLNLSLYDIHIYANSQLITMSPASYKLTSTHNVTINGGSYYQVNTGILEILGDLTLTNTGASALNGGTGTFLFDGTGTQNINSASASINYICALPNIEINKTSGTLNLTGTINFSGSSWNTIAGASSINAGSSVVNLLKSTTLSGQNLILYDLMISGNFSITTISTGLTWTSTNLLTLGGTSSWYQINTGTLNAKGNILVTNTSTSNNVGGTAILLIDGTANQILTGSGVAGGGRLPQVQINKTGGTLTLSNAIISTDNNWTYIAGNIDASTNASTIDFYKTSIIDGQGISSSMAFKNVIFSGLISLGGNMDVDGDLIIRNGVNNKLDITASNNYQLNIAGNWTNNNSVTTSSFNQQNGKVVFDGSSAQSLILSSSTDIEVFYNLEINKSSSGLTFSAPVTISNNIKFTAGNINSSSSNILMIANTATSTGAGIQSFVSGPIAKTGSQAFVFPIGKSGVYMPIAMSAPSLNTNQYTAEYFQTDPNTTYNVNNKDVSLNHVSRCEYWMFGRTSGTSSVAVSLNWNTQSCGVTNLTDLRVALWDGTQWKDQGNGGTTGTTTAGSVVSSSSLSTFGTFTFASSSGANPLPIELLDFTGQCEGKNVMFKWSTVSETNNDYFTLEQTVDGTHWIKLGTIAGAGNSNSVINYSYATMQPFKGIFYYRLKQTDKYGQSKYSNFITIEDCSEEVTGLTIFPIPSKGTFNILFDGKKDQFNAIEIFNAIGESVYYSEQYQDSIDLSYLKSGIYHVHYRLDTIIILKTIVVE